MASLGPQVPGVCSQVFPKYRGGDPTVDLGISRGESSLPDRLGWGLYRRVSGPLRHDLEFGFGVALGPAALIQSPGERQQWQGIPALRGTGHRGSGCWSQEGAVCILALLPAGCVTLNKLSA